MWKVYKRTCPNGKVYIGITKRTLEERMGAGYQNNRAFALDIIKYGKDKIVSEVLEEHENYDTAIERELYYIQLYKEVCYNKIGNTKRQYSSTTVAAQSIVHSTTSTESHTQSPQRKEHIVPLTTKPQDRHTCPISVYDLKGNYITTYPTAKIAAQELKINNGDIISCCKGVKADGKAKYQVKGYVFRYAVDKLENYPDVPVACKKVEQYTLDGEYIRTFNSLKEAWLHTGATIGAIGLVCKGLLKSSGGYVWKYIDK